MFVLGLLGALLARFCLVGLQYLGIIDITKRFLWIEDGKICFEGFSECSDNGFERAAVVERAADRCHNAVAKRFLPERTAER